VEVDYFPNQKKYIFKENYEIIWLAGWLAGWLALIN
jgi:hypothetical protein